MSAPALFSVRAQFTVSATPLPRLQQQGLEAHRVAAAVADAPPTLRSAEVQPLAEMERQAILGAIRTLGGDKLLAARLLGIGKTTLYHELKEYGIADFARWETPCGVTAQDGGSSHNRGGMAGKAHRQITRKQQTRAGATFPDPSAKLSEDKP